MLGGSLGGRSRRVTPGNRKEPQLQRREIPQCARFLGQLPHTSAVQHGGTGLINGTTLVHATFENPGGSSYRIRHTDLTATPLAELADYDGDAIYLVDDATQIQDYLEVDDDGRIFVWNTETGNLERYVISGSAYVFDTTLATGEVGLHASVYNHADGLLYYQHLTGASSGGDLYTIDPDTGSRTNLTSDFQGSNLAHYRMVATPNGTVWKINKQSFSTFSAGTETDWIIGWNGTVLNPGVTVDDGDEKFYGIYSYGSSSVAYMVGPNPTEDLRRVKVLAPGGAVTVLPCTWRSITEFDPRSYGVLHGAAGLQHSGNVFLRAGQGLGSFEGARDTDEGMWRVR